MPPKIVIAMIVVFWLLTCGYFAEQHWLPWLRADSAPPFTVDIADEAAPMDAHWLIQRDDQTIGAATTRLICKKGGDIELRSTIENLELLPPTGLVQIVVPSLTTIQKVDREGQLLAINSKIKLAVTIQNQKFEILARLEGEVRDGKLYSHGHLESPFGDFDQEIDPIALQSRSAMNPMQPVAKLQVYPSQSWTVTNFDPLLEAVMSAAAKYPLLKNLRNFVGRSGPTIIRAEVRSKPEMLEFREQSISCYVVDYSSKDDTFKMGTTWVQASNGKVLLQEVTGIGGMKLTLKRND